MKKNQVNRVSIKVLSIKVSPTPSLPTYEYGSASGAALATTTNSHTTITSPPPAPVLPRSPALSSTGEIKVIIKSVSPSRSSSTRDGKEGYVGAADIHPPPLPPLPPSKNLRPHSYSQNPVHRKLPEVPGSPGVPGSPEITAVRNSPEISVLRYKTDKLHPSLTENTTKFGSGSGSARQMQNTNLNQRMADKFSTEYNDWRRKRSGDSVDSAESSDSADSNSDYRGAVYLVDGQYPAQRTLIDDVLSQFDRAYDALDDPSS